MKKVFRYLFFIFFLLLVCEWIIEWLMNEKHLEWATQVKPVYSWSTYSSTGVRLGEKRGILKLVLRPYITYGNMPNQRTENFSINSKGYRGGEIGPKDPNKVRVIMVGGSTAFGSGLNSDQETFAVKLSEVSGYEVINAAVIGHQSGQELSYLAHELIDLEPNLVIAFDGWNDFMQTRWSKELPQVGDVGFAQVEKQLSDYNELTQGSMPGRIGKSFLTIVFPAIWRGMVGGVKKLTNRHDSIPRSSEDLVSAYIRDHKVMSDFLSVNNGKLFVMLQPDKRAIEVRTKLPSKDEVSRTIGENYLSFTQQVTVGLVSQGITTINLNEESMGLKGEMFLDEVHLNGEANLLLAHSIKERLP